MLSLTWKEQKFRKTISQNKKKKKWIEIKDFGKDQNIQSDVQKQTGDDLYPEEIAIKRRVNSFKSN